MHDFRLTLKTASAVLVDPPQHNRDHEGSDRDRKRWQSEMSAEGTVEQARQKFVQMDVTGSGESLTGKWCLTK